VCGYVLVATVVVVIICKLTIYILCIGFLGGSFIKILNHFAEWQLYIYQTRFSEDGGSKVIYNRHDNRLRLGAIFLVPATRLVLTIVALQS
jgi:hypothetical protein